MLHPAGAARHRNRRGFTQVSLSSTAQCRCGPVQLPVQPSSAHDLALADVGADVDAGGSWAACGRTRSAGCEAWAMITIQARWPGGSYGL